MIRRNRIAGREIEHPGSSNAAIRELEYRGGYTVILATAEVQVHTGKYILRGGIFPPAVAYGKRLFYKAFIYAGTGLLVTIQRIELLLDITLPVVQ